MKKRNDARNEEKKDLSVLEKVEVKGNSKEDLLNTRMFDDHIHLTLDDITTKINEIMATDLSIMDDNDNMMRWTMLPSVLLDSDNNKEQFIEVTKYIDELLVPVLEKVELINTVAAMLVVGKVELNLEDVNNLFMLAYFFKDREISEYKREYTILSDDELLYEVRKSSLDIDKRTLLLDYIITESIKDNLDITQESAIAKFNKKMLNLLQEKDVDKILNLENYMNDIEVDQVDFRDSLNG
ncbi:MAG: hypothetical protein RSB99_01460 [Bacilli bacterium]